MNYDAWSFLHLHIVPPPASDHCLLSPPPLADSSSPHHMSHHQSGAPDQSSKAPCGTCHPTVWWSDPAVVCDLCGMWYHAACQSAGSNTHANLNDSKVSWHCIRCCVPNYSMTAFDLFGIDGDLTADFSSISVSSDAKNFRPLHCSTRTWASQQDKQRNRSLCLLNVNF